MSTTRELHFSDVVWNTETRRLEFHDGTPVGARKLTDARIDRAMSLNAPEDVFETIAANTAHTQITAKSLARNAAGVTLASVYARLRLPANEPFNTAVIHAPHAQNAE